MKTTSENSKKMSGQKMTYSIIAGMLILSLISLVLVITINTYENKAALLYEKAIDGENGVIEFNSLPNIESKMLMENDIMILIDAILVKYPYSSPAARALYYKGFVYFNINKFEESKKIFSSFIKKFKNHFLSEKAYYFLGMSLANLNEIDVAIDTLKNFEKSKNKSYYNALAFYTIGLLYEKKNDSENSVKYYDKVINDYSDSTHKDSALKRKTIIINNIDSFKL